VCVLSVCVCVCVHAHACVYGADDEHAWALSSEV
jgi:hypothetical protein